MVHTARIMRCIPAQVNGCNGSKSTNKARTHSLVRQRIQCEPDLTSSLRPRKLKSIYVVCDTTPIDSGPQTSTDTRSLTSHFKRRRDRRYATSHAPRATNGALCARAAQAPQTPTQPGGREGLSATVKHTLPPTRRTRPVSHWMRHALRPCMLLAHDAAPMNENRDANHEASSVKGCCFNAWSYFTLSASCAASMLATQSPLT